MLRAITEAERGCAFPCLRGGAVRAAGFLRERRKARAGEGREAWTGVHGVQPQGAVKKQSTFLWLDQSTREKDELRRAG